MMRRYNIRLKPFYVAALLLLAGVLGCVHEEVEIPAPKGQTITIEMTIPGFEIPVTRSIEEGKGEAAVHTVDVLVFSDGEVPTLLHHEVAVDIRQSISEPHYMVSFNVSMQPIENAGTVVVIANAKEQVDFVINSMPYATKPSILAALRFHTTSDNSRYEWNISNPGYTPIPMYGEAAVTGITSGMKITGIELIRMLARIDVENQVNGNIFDLEEIYLVNYHTGGFIAPAWEDDTGAILKKEDEGYPYSNNTDPIIPDDAGWPENKQEAAMKYTYDQDNNTPGPLLTGQIYAYEEPKVTTPGDPTRKIGLILKGNYRGAECFYRIDFTTDRGGISGAPEVEYMPLYRNHKYIVTITAAEGIGYDTFEQAVSSTTVLSNLKTSILVVDMAGINNIVFDGQYFMGVESRVIDLPWGMNKQTTHRISSDYHGDWKAKILDAETTTWLRFPNNQATTYGTDINLSGMLFEVTAVASSVNGRIEFTAGRLRDTLTVRRVPITDMFARSNIVQNSDELIFAVTVEDNLRIPAWSQGVFFKWGSLLALAPAGNPYDPATHVVFNPTGFNPSAWGNGLAGWDKIPYAHSDFGFTTTASGADDADAFATYSNNTGFDQGAGIGDICRYISAKRTWVEGKWRLPTYDELILLDKETATGAGAGTFVNTTATLNQTPASYLYGDFNPGSGWFAGRNVASSNPSESDMTTPPDGTLFLPAAGHRYPNGDGDVVHVGAYGYYWTATPYDGITVNYPLLSKYGMVFYEADRSYAFPIRCIRDY